MKTGAICKKSQYMVIDMKFGVEGAKKVTCLYAIKSR
jgi:hypothetical protein